MLKGKWHLRAIVNFKYIWQFHNTEPIARKTLFLPKHQGGIGLIHPQYHSLAMRLKNFLKLKEKTNQETGIILTRYDLASILYRLHKDFKYMISNNTIIIEKLNINFYYEDIINYLKKTKHNTWTPKKLSKNLQTNNTKRIQTLYWNMTITLESILTTNFIERFIEKHLLLI